MSRENKAARPKPPAPANVSIRSRLDEPGEHRGLGWDRGRDEEVSIRSRLDEPGELKDRLAVRPHPKSFNPLPAR